MLKGKGLPNKFWAEAVNSVVYILNRSPTKAVRNKTPFEAWNKQKPQVNQLRVFGCIAYALKPSQEREKFDEKGEKFIFIGYSDESKGYRLFNPKKNQLIMSRDVVFDEMAAWKWDGNSLSAPKLFEIPEPATFHGNFHPSASQNTSSSSSPAASPSRLSGSSSSEEVSSESESPPRKVRPLLDFYQSSDVVFFAYEPQNFEEAAKEEVWTKVMNEEMASIEKNHTWKLVDLPNGRDVIRLK